MTECGEMRCKAAADDVAFFLWSKFVQVSAYNDTLWQRLQGLADTVDLHGSIQINIVIHISDINTECCLIEKSKGIVHPKIINTLQFC